MAKKNEKQQPSSIREALNAATIARLEAVWLGTRMYRAIFFALAAATAGAAQFITWGPTQSPTAAQVVGITATIVVFLAALISVFTERDAVREIEIAQRAVSRIEDLQDRLEENARLWPNVDRMVALHQATSLFRDHLESSCVAMVGDERTLLSGMTTLVRRQLPAAADFSLADQWTICLYKAEQITADCRFVLKLVEHLRALECSKGTAREWPEGIGVAGISFSNASEILIEDLTSDGARAIFKPAGMERIYDDDRYRSMVAVPIMVQGEAKPWGIVTATSDAVGHFNHDAEDGLKPVDAIRALAKYAALAVAMVQARDRAANPAPVAP